MTDNNYRLFQDWMANQFSHNEMADIANYGCACGFPGLIYYSQTTDLYRKYKDDIWSMLDDDAEAYGYSVPEFIATFNKATNDADQFENILVWYAAEKIADEITQGEYKEEAEL